MSTKTLFEKTQQKLLQKKKVIVEKNQNRKQFWLFRSSNHSLQVLTTKITELTERLQRKKNDGCYFDGRKPAHILLRTDSQKLRRNRM